MARKNFLFITIIYLLILLEFGVNCSKLNVPRVLLPIFNDISTNFTLEVSDDGCYKWSTSRLDLVQLIPLDYDVDKECASRVVVATITKEHSRNTAIVLAEDTLTEQILRCDVIVDVISSLNIVTTTRELFMEEAPEAFEVRAYDDQGNEFSTLEGVQFEWTLCNPGGIENAVLRFITFKDSPYETPPTIEAFENMGKQGHIVLLEGYKTGSAKVSVRLPHSEYKRLDGIEVSLMVIANLIIEPSDVYLLRGDVFHYKIIQVKQGRLEEIHLPSSQYYLVSENPEIGIIEKNSGYFTGMGIGKTRVFLHDSNVKEDQSLKLPSATVYVTSPARLQLLLLPHRNWAALLGERYDIVVEMFAFNDHKIHIGEEVILKTVIDEKYFQPFFRSANGSFIMGEAIQQGTTEIQTTLLSVVSTKLGTINMDQKLTAKAEMLIFAAMNVFPQEVILPWDPIVKPRYEIDLKATGGDNKFLWTTSNHSIGVVTQTGLVRTHFHGQFDTCVSMLRNHHNKQCSKFFILPPGKMEIVEFIMEGEVGTPIFIHIALYGDRPKVGGTVQIPFTKCKELPFEIKTSDNNFFYNETAVSEPIGISCASIGVVGLAVGTCRVTVEYKRDDVNLEQTVTIAAYRPLKLINPTCGETILALGTSRNLVFTGGPRPWSGHPSEHIVSVFSTQPNIVEVIDESHLYKVPGGSDTYVIRAICKELGESIITLTVFNKPLVPKCKHQKSFATSIVVCGQPEYITLQPEIKVPDISSCPMDLNAERVIVQNYRNIDLIVNVKDGYGRKFDNISSLEFKWTLNPYSLGEITYTNGVLEKNYIEDNILLPNKTNQVIKPVNQVGLMDVKATIVGYKTDFLKINNIKIVPRLIPITSQITLYLVDDTIVLPNKTSIYNHPLNKQTLKVKQGSGYNELKLSSKDIADVKYNEGLRQIEITPKQTGQLHVSVQDLCLVCSPIIIVLNIVYVATIRVEMSDRVELGKCIPAVVKFYDEFDNLMPLPKLDYLDARFSITDKIVSLKLAEQTKEKPWGVGEIHYVVSGLELGETKINFAAGRGPKEVTSVPLNIQVFAPLKLFPRNATMLVGSVLQIISQGGPQPDTNIDWTIESENIAEMQSNGILHALKIGHTKVTARAVSINPATGQKVSNSKDSIDVFVIPLVGIKLSAPLTRFLVGATVPIWISGLPEKLSPLLLGSVDPPLDFFWTTKCANIISVHGLFEDVGVKDNPSNKVAVHVEGLRSGFCNLEINVTVPGSVAGVKESQKTFSSFVQMEVIDDLQLSAPSGFTGEAILMAPFSNFKLNTNKDGLDVLKYNVQSEEQQLKSNGKFFSTQRRVVTVDTDGTVTSNDIIGRSMVIITATDDHGLKQTLNLIIEVKPIHYMLLSVSTVWMIPNEENINVVPVGSQLKIIASYHDNTGSKFVASQCDLNYRANRFDLLDFKKGTDNSTIEAHILQKGSIVLKVWSDNCFQITDFMHILTGQIASPNTNIVTSGDVLCMHSSVTDKRGNYGTWNAEPDNIMSVNSSSGIGQVASTINPNKLYIQYALTPSARISVDVEPITSISYVYDTNRIITNTPNNIFKVALLFKDAKNQNKKSNMHGDWHCNRQWSNEITRFHFKCHIGFEENVTYDIFDVFDVYPAFNKELGLYSCNLVASNEISVNTSIIQSNVILKVTSDNRVESELLKIQFLPAVFIEKKELIVNNPHLSAVLTLYGLPEVLIQVDVTAVDQALIDVGSVHVMSPTMHSYDIKILDYHWKLQELHDPLSIIVSSPITKQMEKIEVKLGDNSALPFCAARQTGSPLGNFLLEHKQTIFILFVMFVLFFITFYAYSYYIQPIINVNVAAAGTNQLYAPYNRLQPIPGENTLFLTSSPHTPRSLGSPQTCRALNTSISPTARYSPEGNRISPELRRNRRYM